MYAEAVVQAGGEPVEIALAGSDGEILRLARTCEGVLLPGSPSDVDPRLYGQEPGSACAAADPAREQVDRLLLEEAYAAGCPVLGICFGAQFLNVWRGGTLLQDVSCLPVNHAAGASVGVAHSAVISGGSLLASLVDTEECLVSPDTVRLPMNSSHHQAVDRVGEGLRVTALSWEDGIVEAIEGEGTEEMPAFLLGVQWHPERSVLVSATSRAIFAGFVAASGRVRSGSRVGWSQR